MTQAVQLLLIDTLEAEFRAFLEQLEACPAALLSRQPWQGHSVAWHALHVMDWTRCVIQPGLQGVNPVLTYSYLGFEQQTWARAVYGPTLAYEQDSKEKIVSALRGVFFGEALEAVRQAPHERFSPEASWTTLKQPRPVLAGLTYHIRHVAYHRGQMQQVSAAPDSMIEEQNP